MRFIVILFAIICFSFTKLYAQKVSLKLVNAPMDTLFKKIKEQTGYTPLYTIELLKKANPVTITIKDAPLNEALDKIFALQPIDYTLYNKLIVLKDKEVSTEAVTLEDYFITGKVTDDKGETLPGATVFLANTKNATATDTSGVFRLDKLLPGTYEVVVKMLGFEVYDQQVNIQQNSSELHIRLKEANIVLNTVNITAMPSKLRAAFLQLFIEFFIGQSADAKKCKILNPEVININLDSKSGIMAGSSDQFIIIENQTLGYKIHYLLKDLKVNLGRHLMYYTGSSYFEELDGTTSQQKKWQKNRQLTYEGSIRHFFLAAFNHTLKEDGFLVYRFPEAAAFTGLKKFDQKYYSPLNDPYSLFSNADKNIKQFNVGALKKDSTVLYVVYTKKDEPYAFTSSGRNIRPPFKIPGSSQVSVIYPLLDSMLVDKNGNIDPKNSISYGGYWSWKMAAGFLPPDYSPPVIAPPIVKHPTPPVLAAGAKAIIKAIDTLRNQLSVEKLYLQTDKPYYLLNDTLHFKAYLLRGDFLVPLAKSGLLYIELDDEAGRSVKRIMVPVASGVSNGDIVLDEREIAEGSYTLRAYTNWMRNFGEDYIFKKNIYISALSGTTLVKANFTLDSFPGKNKVEASLSFANEEKKPIPLKDIQLKVMNGKHALFNDRVTTGIDGGLNVNFDLADKSAIDNLYILANQTGRGADTAHLMIPVTLNRAENTDVQFMPEGGSLVAGIATKLGFKAIGEDGKGVDVSGKIINGKNQTVTLIQTLHKGMGSFELTPEAGESYAAVINLPNKTTKNYLLPKVSPVGTALRITPKGNDSLEITLTATATTAATNNYFLIGQSRGIVCYAAQVAFRETEVKKTISTALFPSGITRFTLLSADETPLNERIIYINHHDNLNITVNTNKPAYTTRDSVALGIQVKDKDGNPLQGTFSLAVTDDSQVKQDTTGSNILNDLLVTSDLKGTIEEPGWYFDPDSYREDVTTNDSGITATASATQKAIALDNLLLTQGWVGYDWKQVFNPLKQPQYPVETEFIIQGKVTNVFNNPIKQTHVTLLQKQPTMVMDTLTNNEGRFVFRSPKLFPPDSAYYLVQAKNKSNENFNVGVEVNEFVPPVYSTTRRLLPWYVNSDTTLLNNFGTTAAQLKAVANYKGEGTLLKTVEIKDKKIIPGSHNRNAPGEADITMDEKEMNAAKKMTLYELLAHKFKSFYKVSNFGHPRYLLNGRLVAFVIDGVPIQGSSMDEYNVPTPVDLYMDYLTAEDIKGIEIMIQPRYALAYNPNITGMLIMLPERNVPLYLEITTYSGHGAYLRHIPGMYVYKPVGFITPKQFYRPRYTIKNQNTAPGTDLRSTIHWGPNVITDKDGKATVSFFSADKPASYTVIMEGTDMNGNLGYKRQQIKVASTAAGK